MRLGFEAQSVLLVHYQSMEIHWNIFVLLVKQKTLWYVLISRLLNVSFTELWIMNLSLFLAVKDGVSFSKYQWSKCSRAPGPVDNSTLTLHYFQAFISNWHHFIALITRSNKSEIRKKKTDTDWCPSLSPDSLIKLINLYAEEMSNANGTNQP